MSPSLYRHLHISSHLLEQKHPSHRPVLAFEGAAKEAAAVLGVKQALVSITHDRSGDVAHATVILARSPTPKDLE